VKAKILATIMVFFTASVFGADYSIPLEFDRDSSEPAGVDPQKMADSETDYDTVELQEYAEETVQKMRNYLRTLQKNASEKIQKQLMGTWELKNRTGQNIFKNHQWGAGQEFHISSSEENDGLTYIKDTSYAILYFARNGAVYMVTNWDRIMRQIKIYGNNLYFYILEYDKWILDPIHEGGKYFYVNPAHQNISADSNDGITENTNESNLEKSTPLADAAKNLEAQQKPSGAAIESKQPSTTGNKKPPELPLAWFLIGGALFVSFVGVVVIVWIGVGGILKRRKK
jgi:hypothetical protein